MTTVAISGLPVATVINAADIVPFVQAGTTKSITKTLLFTSPTMVTPVLGAATATSLAVSGLATVGTTLGVTGATTLSSTLAVTGATTGTTVAVSNVIGTTAAALTLGITAFVLPTPKAINFVGAGTIKTITVPTLFSTGGGEITLIPTAAFTWDATGNIAVAGTAVISRALTMTYDSFTAKFYPSYV